MTWTIARFGSRFNLLFEPYKRRVMHSALGRFFDEPLDMQVGVMGPCGSLRVLPLTQQKTGADGTPIRDLYNAEQFDRFNSVTYRGYCEECRLRFEFNVHSVFWPQNDRLCTMPAFYLEMRVSPVRRVRWVKPTGPAPERVKLFLRLQRQGTTITASPDGYQGDLSAEALAMDEEAAHSPLAQIAMSYAAPLRPEPKGLIEAGVDYGGEPETVEVQERIVSLNPSCGITADGQGLTCELPVSEPGSGVKWRLVWATHVAEPVLTIREQGRTERARMHYTRFWDNVDAVVAEAIETRDDRLAHSRRFEKLIEQAPLDRAQSHLLHQTFQSFASNAWWCDVQEGGGQGSGVRSQASGGDGSTSGGGASSGGGVRDWYSVMEGSSGFLSTTDVEYNNIMFYLALWPRLLKLQFENWARRVNTHEASGGAFISHDIGFGTDATRQFYGHAMELEENGNFLLMLQAYTRWTGDTGPARRYAELIEDLARYLIWTDRERCGFPTEGIANTIDDASPALRYGPKPTYLAVKRLAGLQAVADLLQFSDRPELAKRCEALVEEDVKKVEMDAWLGDHYAVCMEKSAVGVMDPATGKPAAALELPDWDAYCIHTPNALLLPMMIGQPSLLGLDRMRLDIAASDRENQGRYADGHTSDDPDNCRVSQNLWRDMIGRYLGMSGPSSAGQYWDMQVMSNTGLQSYGYVDTYITNALAFYSRGIVTLGWFMATPRLVVDRLAPGGSYITVEPNRGMPQRWPLLALADWHTGRVPVCVVDAEGHVTIEGETDPVIIHGNEPDASSQQTPGLIG